MTTAKWQRGNVVMDGNGENGTWSSGYYGSGSLGRLATWEQGERDKVHEDEEKRRIVVRLTVWTWGPRRVACFVSWSFFSFSRRLSTKGWKYWLWRFGSRQLFLQGVGFVMF